MPAARNQMRFLGARLATISRGLWSLIFNATAPCRDSNCGRRSMGPTTAWGVTTGTSRIIPFRNLVGNDVLVAGFASWIGLKNLPQVDRMKPLLRKRLIAGRNGSLKHHH
jgi:hypothetical protein